MTPSSIRQIRWHSGGIKVMSIHEKREGFFLILLKPIHWWESNIMCFITPLTTHRISNLCYAAWFWKIVTTVTSIYMILKRWFGYLFSFYWLHFSFRLLKYFQSVVLNAFPIMTLFGWVLH